MASSTTNLNLYKKDPTTDGSDTFNITTMLNENWDKIDAASWTAIVSSTELGRLSGVTSSVQTQLNSKQGIITYSDTDLTPGTSALTTGEFYAYYE